MEKQFENTIITKEKMSVIHSFDGCTDYCYKDKQGDCIVSRYGSFPGVHFFYKKFHRQNCMLRIQTPTKNMLVIEHCRVGCVECQANEEYFYLKPGDVAIRRTDGSVQKIYFPADYYRGIDIVIDMEKAPHSFGHILEELNIDFAMLLEKLYMGENCFCFLRQNPHMEHIFSELYSVPDTVKPGYLKIKILELLLFLSGMDPKEISPVMRRLSPGQIRLARELHKYLAEHLMEQMTIDQLAQQFSVSPTRLKDSFRQTYGTSLHAFISEQRMRAAAELLRQTDRKVADVAGECGYSNASKFAAVFQRVMGDTPTQYRLKKTSKLE